MELVGRESKGSSVFSWADEVEKEEQEAAAGAGSDQAQLQQKQKPNPFGSARPREVVLQDKGIDWRKLDLHLQQQQQPSPLRHESQTEKLRKQSSPQPAATTILNSKLPVRLRGSPTVSSQPQVILTPQIQSPILFVPPLRYPPKYVAGFLYEPWVSTAPNALDSGIYQHFKLEKENRSQGGGKFHNLKSESAMCGNTRRTTTELVQAKEAQQKGRILGESVVYGNKPEADSATRKEKFHGRNSVGLPLVNQNMRMSANGRQPRNIQDDSGMDGTAFQVTENNKAMKHKWQKVTRKLHDDLSAKQVNNGGRRDTAHSKIKGDRAGLGRNNKKNFEKKEIKLQTY